MHYELKEVLRLQREINEKLISEMVSMHWINVKDRLPNEAFWILCGGSKIGSVDHGCLIDGKFYMHGEKDKPMKWVTHWMPLPEPPKD
jgi:hypothetical protein